MARRSRFAHAGGVVDCDASSGLFQHDGMGTTGAVVCGKRGGADCRARRQYERVRRLREARWCAARRPESHAYSWTGPAATGAERVDAAACGAARDVFGPFGCAAGLLSPHATEPGATR